MEIQSFTPPPPPPPPAPKPAAPVELKAPEKPRTLTTPLDGTAFSQPGGLAESWGDVPELEDLGLDEPLPDLNEVYQAVFNYPADETGQATWGARMQEMQAAGFDAGQIRTMIEGEVRAAAGKPAAGAGSTGNGVAWPKGADPSLVPASGGMSQLLGIKDDREFVHQAIKQILGHEEVDDEKRRRAGEDPEWAKHVAWLESCTPDNLKVLKDLQTRMPPEEARKELIKAFVNSDEFKGQVGNQQANLREGMPVTLQYPDENGQLQEMPFLWHSQNTLMAGGDVAKYYGGDGLPLDKPMGFKDVMRFAENHVCNGTSPFELGKVASTSQAAKDLQKTAGDLYGFFWGYPSKPPGDGQTLDFLQQKRSEIRQAVAADPSLQSNALETMRVLDAVIGAGSVVKDHGATTFLKSVPGAKVGWYANGDPTGQPLPVDEQTVPKGDKPRYAEIMQHYARQTYDEGIQDPNSYVSRTRNYWLT